MKQPVTAAEEGFDSLLSRPPSVNVGSSLIISLLLFVATLILYLPAFSNGFVNYDDPAYVTSNAHVLQGLSWSNVRWALTATVEANWHPLTWISHMADVQFFGTNPRGHHAVSVLLHGLNVVLLFLVLKRATGYSLRSALVAGLFAVHPLNVECVAWVAERKSLLSMLFLLLTMRAYGWYANKRGFGRYGLVVLLFALGLAAKPMVVTLPVLLLLWDFWPLKRIAYRFTKGGDDGVLAGCRKDSALCFVGSKFLDHALRATWRRSAGIDGTFAAESADRKCNPFLCCLSRERNLAVGAGRFLPPSQRGIYSGGR